MGNRRHLREAFFKAHPNCCFCGGGTVATEEDHIPARSLFRRREWPAGYAFPACSACNRESSSDELAMGFLVRITISDLDAEGERELERAMEKLHDRRPDWIAGMKAMNRVETRRHLRERGLSLETFRGIELSVVTMPPDLVAVPERYASKLGKALYYKHTGRILPSSGFVKVAVFPNAEFMASSFPRDSFSILTTVPGISRSGRSLADQFAYRYAVVEEGAAAAFLVQFGESVAIAIFMYWDRLAYEERGAVRAEGGHPTPGITSKV